MQLIKLVRDWTDFSVLPWLSFQDIANTEAVNGSTHVALLLSRAWEKGAWRALVGFTVAPGIMAIPGKASADVHILAQRRQELNAMFPVLFRASVCGPKRVPLPTVHDAHRLVSALAQAQSASANHLSIGGRAACVSVARACFPETLSMQLRSKDENPFLCSGPVPVTCLGRAHIGAACSYNLEFALNSEAMYIRVSERTASNSSQPGSLRNDHRALCANHEHHHREVAKEPRIKFLAVDMCASLEPLIRTRGTIVFVGGDWHKARGLVSSSVSRAALATILKVGLTCVICVRDVQGPTARSVDQVHALNIDAPSRSQRAPHR